MNRKEQIERIQYYETILQAAKDGEVSSRQLRELDERYPGYGFARNKGYGTKEHIEALKRLGPCPEHRRSFITHFV